MQNNDLTNDVDYNLLMELELVDILKCTIPELSHKY
ncbi:hypothetical protein Lepto7375DRAFT_5174 [Leptolyngbya sp. PCC 7375]|nr:hypothetical protein Lepto7375DRAFT_5174 [Leptolyngbya sp. PCC 7375]